MTTPHKNFIEGSLERFEKEFCHYGDSEWNDENGFPDCVGAYHIRKPKPPEEKHATKCSANGGKACVCDGYHTFDELYEHRIVLYIALCTFARTYAEVWCSQKHSDGSEWEGWFILGIGKNKGEQITYHIPMKYWNDVRTFADVLEEAPEFDGHTSDDVLNRIKLFSVVSLTMLVWSQDGDGFKLAS
jgi:hypothetical protein